MYNKNTGSRSSVWYLLILLVALVVFLVLGNIAFDMVFGNESSGVSGYVRDLFGFNGESFTDMTGIREAIEGKNAVDRELTESMDILNGL